MGAETRVQSPDSVPHPLLMRSARRKHVHTVRVVHGESRAVDYRQGSPFHFQRSAQIL